MDINDDVRGKKRKSMELGFASNYSGRTTIASVVTKVFCNGWVLLSSYANIWIINTYLLFLSFYKAWVCADLDYSTFWASLTQFLADDL